MALAATLHCTVRHRDVVAIQFHGGACQLLVPFVVASKRSPLLAFPELQFADEVAGDGSNLHSTLGALGRGVAGTVVRGTYYRRPVAIKVMMNPDEFTTERDVMQKVPPHPNVVEFVGTCSRRPFQGFIVLELVTGGSLDSVLYPNGVDQPPLPMSPPYVVRVLRDVAAALTHIHAHGVVHLDLKPANCLIASDDPDSASPCIKICDFGMSHARSSLNTVKGKEIEGTLPYMSPEMCSGRLFGAKSDVYSFGVMAWEMLAVRPPYSELPRTTSLFEAKANGEPPGLFPAAGHPLLTLLRLTLAADRVDRPTAEDTVDMLRDVDVARVTVGPGAIPARRPAQAMGRSSGGGGGGAGGNVYGDLPPPIDGGGAGGGGTGLIYTKPPVRNQNYGQGPPPLEDDAASRYKSVPNVPYDARQQSLAANQPSSDYAMLSMAASGRGASAYRSPYSRSGGRPGVQDYAPVPPDVQRQRGAPGLPGAQRRQQGAGAGYAVLPPSVQRQRGDPYSPVPAAVLRGSAPAQRTPAHLQQNQRPASADYETVPRQNADSGYDLMSLPSDAAGYRGLDGRRASSAQFSSLAGGGAGVTPRMPEASDYRGKPWFQPLARADAEAWLRSRPVGTFLVRPSSQRGILSISHRETDGTCGHGIIRLWYGQHDPKTGESRFGYSIEESSKTYSTLEDLLQTLPAIRLEDYGLTRHPNQ